MKRMIAFPVLLALLLVLCLPAAAADTGYTGIVDPETGEAYTEGTNASDSGSGRSALSSSMYYDWDTHDFVYPIAESLGEVHASVADGMVLSVPVSVDPGTDASVKVFYNGSEYSGTLRNLNQVGEYVVSAQVSGQNQRLLGFTLLGESTNVLHTFVVPDGFYILSAERNGEDIYMDRYNVDMEAEGSYLIEYECSPTNMVYKLEVQIDRTPPALSFSGRIDNQGRVRSRLDFSGLESGDSIYLTRSGEVVAATVEPDGTGSSPDPGNYVMIVSDAAGNRVEYDFIILQYFNLQSWIFFLIVIASLCTLAGYILVKRKRLKIG